MWHANILQGILEIDAVDSSGFKANLFNNFTTILGPNSGGEYPVEPLGSLRFCRQREPL